MMKFTNAANVHLSRTISFVAVAVIGVLSMMTTMAAEASTASTTFGQWPTTTTIIGHHRDGRRRAFDISNNEVIGGGRMGLLQPVTSSSSSLSPLVTSATNIPRGGGPFTNEYDKFLDKLFDNADTNHDGSISKDEIFELVLYMYIKINTQAPVPPPSRQKVNRMFYKADMTHNNRLNREEFKKLMKLLHKRALPRFLFSKIMKMIVAPILALTTVSKLTGNVQFLVDIAEQFPEGVANILKNSDIWKVALTVFYIITGVKVVLGIVDSILDFLTLKDTPEEQKKGLRRFFR